MNDADIQRMFRQLDLILNLIQETRSAIKLLKQCGNDGADDPLIPNRQLAEILDVRTKQIIEYRKKKTYRSRNHPKSCLFPKVCREEIYRRTHKQRR